jgi:hypothetical protein
MSYRTRGPRQLFKYPTEGKSRKEKNIRAKIRRKQDKRRRVIHEFI